MRYIICHIFRAAHQTQIVQSLGCRGGEWAYKTW